MLLALIPGVGRILLRRGVDSATNPLVLLRQAFITFCMGIVMFGIVLAFLWPSQSKEPHSPPLALGLVALGMIAAVVGWAVERPLVCTDDASLAGSYRTRFFLRIAFAESAALFGFVGFFIASVWWVYPAGAAIAFIGFARAAPTRARLRRDQERLSEQSCFRSLVAALSRRPDQPG